MATTIESSVTGAVNAGGPSSAQAGSQSDELRDNFMTMLVAQLQNQDPLDPMDNNEMTSQLAQINAVSGIEDLNATLKGIGTQIDAGQALEAAGLIGQGVMVPGDRVLVGSDDEGRVSTTPFGIELDAPADNVTVTISDAGGQVVRRYDIGPVEAGVSSFQWPGDTSGGENAPDGAYRVSVEAVQGDRTLSAETLNYAMVNAITPADQDGGFLLDLGGVQGQVGLADIRQIL
ncbi:MAG TPA: flagellar hook assembly protein FlgD [Halomonas sp.]|nr:flagellar hook assembly protein FlgD [Halomonas sp.]